ncbi:RmlC-like cupins superfamily protein, putative [Medicago truncatula]|uniref:RmlC-like cupins superfamily protein, putative n=1 Tax=Medicago truncatula TaxID=3880 RepID=G7KMX2_MEDTR|nr:RmlC-like cupins superfamily protein, putative [Medicago truncatula]
MGLSSKTPNGANESVEFGAGDLVVFPKGMSCTWDQGRSYEFGGSALSDPAWDVSVVVNKRYLFE